MTRTYRVDSAILVAVVTAILYTWSTAHYHGYIKSLKLSAEMMERNFHQVIYDGLVISFAPVLLLIIFAVLILWFFSYALLPGYINWVRKSFKNKRRILLLRNRLFGKRDEPKIEINAKRLAVKVWIIAFGSLFYVATLVYFEQNGASEAREFIAAVSSGNLASSRKINVLIDGEPKSLAFVGCGVRVCAGLEAGTGLVHYVNSSKGYSFKYKAKGQE